MEYPGCLGFHECVTVPGFSEWVEVQSDETLDSFTAEELIKRFKTERGEN